MKIEAMPLQLSEAYTPEVVRTHNNRVQFLSEHKDQAVCVLKTQSYSLYTCKGKGKRVWYYAVAEGELVYLMHLNPLAFVRPDGIKPKVVYQGSVWRKPESALLNMANLPKSVFWSLLKPGTAIVSDSMQSEQGRIFWLRRMGEALARGYIAEALNLKDGSPITVRKIIPIVQGDRVEKFWTLAVDGDHRGLNWRFCIRKP